MTSFRYDAQVLARYPGLAGGVLLADGLQNNEAVPALAELYAAEQAAVKARLGDLPLSDIPSLAAWRAAFRGFGVDPTKYRSAAEALLRRLTKKGDIPGINPLVDIGNLVSIRYGLPVAVVDRRAVSGGITVRFADGTEQASMLGEDENDPPQPGEVIFTDAANHVIARRWCWRQSMESAAQPHTTAVIVTCEAHHVGGREAVAQALDDLAGLLARYTGGHVRTKAVLGAGQDSV